MEPIKLVSPDLGKASSFPDAVVLEQAVTGERRTYVRDVDPVCHPMSARKHSGQPLLDDCWVCSNCGNAFTPSKFVRATDRFCRWCGFRIEQEYEDE